MASISERPAFFPSAKRKEIMEASSFDDAKSTLERTIRSHHFNHAVDVFVPNVKRVSTEFDKILGADDECEYYLVEDVSLAKILDWDFIGAFVRNGRMTIVSDGTRVDVDNCVSVHHPGQLVLSLLKDSYEELGLVGKPSHTSGKSRPTKYVVNVDLLDKNFYPGRKLYDKALKLFEQRTWLRFTLLFCWTPHDDSISSRSLYNYLQGWKNDAVVAVGDDGQEMARVTKIKACKPRFKVQTVKRLLPKLSCFDLAAAAAIDPDRNCSFSEFIEWLGIVSFDIEYGDHIDPFISTYACPNLIDESPGNVSHGRWSGFFSSDTLLRLVRQLRERLLESAESGGDWAAVVVHEFVDVPSVGNDDNFRCHPSSDMYAVVVFPNSRYWLCRGPGTLERLEKEKSEKTKEIKK